MQAGTRCAAAVVLVYSLTVLIVVWPGEGIIAPQLPGPMIAMLVVNSQVVDSEVVDSEVVDSEVLDSELVDSEMVDS